MGASSSFGVGGVGAVASVLLTLASVAAAGPDRPRVLNGFSLAASELPVEEIVPGGPARDGIPALEDPEVLPGDNAPWAEDTRVLGIEVGGEARAYPVAILDWHELVNDELGGVPILVSYCPLCGTGMVFDRRVETRGPPRRFGVSGLLYRSDVLMYDRETESLWSQILARAVTGPSRGRELRVLRSRMDRWDAWREAHPATTVLGRRTGHARDYARSPYAGYEQSARLAFPVPRDDRYHPKTPTLGLRLPGGAARAYPAPEITRGGGVVTETLEGAAVRVAYDPERNAFEVSAPQAAAVIEGYWFAWAAFHPDTSVYVAPPPQNEATPAVPSPRRRFP